MYLLIHEGTNLYVPCRCWRGKWRHPLSPRRSFYLFILFIVMVSWNWILFRVVISQRRLWPMRVVWQPGADRGWLVLPFVFLPDWLNVTHTSSLHPKKTKIKRLESPQSLRPGLPSATITNLIYGLFLLTAGRNRRRVIWREKMSEWKSHGKRRGESGDKGVKSQEGRSR